MLVKIESRYKKFNDYFLEADEDEGGATSSTYSMKSDKKNEDDYDAIEPDDPSVLDDGDVSVLDDNNDEADAANYSDMKPDDDTGNENNTNTDDVAVLDDNENNDGTTDGGNNDDVSVLDDNNDEADAANYSDMKPDDDIGNENDGAEDNADDVAVLDDDADQNDQNNEDGTTDNNSNNEQNKKEPVISEAHKKFYLYQKFVSMYNYINKYINKLQIFTCNDIYYTSIIKLTLNKLTVLKKTLYEYLMIKFDKVSYVESYVFYETCYNIMKLSIDLLQNTVDNLKQ